MEEEARIAATNDRLADPSLGYSVIEADGTPMGLAGVIPVSPAGLALRPDFIGDAEPIVALHPGHWGRGIAAHALRAVIARAFSDPARARLVAFVDEGNEASHRLLRRVGFASIGELAGPIGPLTAYALLRARHAPATAS